MDVTITRYYVYTITKNHLLTTDHLMKFQDGATIIGHLTKLQILSFIKITLWGSMDKSSFWVPWRAIFISNRWILIRNRYTRCDRDTYVSWQVAGNVMLICKRSTLHVVGHRKTVNKWEPLFYYREKRSNTRCMMRRMILEKPTLHFDPFSIV